MIRLIIMFAGFLSLMFCINCVSHNMKWTWIRNALNKTSHAAQLTQTLELAASSASSHPFLTAEFQKKLDDLTGSVLSAGNEIELLPDHWSTDAKLELIKSAKSSVFVSTFLLICDEGGKQFLDHLAAAAARGIDVRVVIDGGVWSRLYGGSCPNDYLQKGVKVARSNYAFLGSDENLKLHDKLFIIDGETGITGGQNIGSYWADSSGEDGNFRDTDIMVRGPAVNDMALRYVRLWKKIHPFDHGLESYEALLANRYRLFFKKNLVGAQNYANWLSEKQQKGLCRFVGQDPQLGTHHVFKVYTALTLASRKQIVLHVPSLNGLGSPEQEGLLKALVDMARLKNVQVDIITNGPGLIHSRIMNKVVGWIYGIFTLGQVYDSVKDTALNIYAYNFWLHSKMFNFDGLAIAVGSFNFDESGVDWMENTLICMDKDLSATTTNLLVRDFANSRLLPKATTKANT